jgi:hypothetical protein
MRSMWISAASARTLRSPGSEVRISSPSAARHTTVASIASRWPLRASSSPARRASGSSIAATAVPASSRVTGHLRATATTPDLRDHSPAGHRHRPASRSRFSSATTPRSTATNAPRSGPASGRTLATGPPALAPGLLRAAHHDRPAACTSGSLPHLLLGDLTMLGLVARQELI